MAILILVVALALAWSRLDRRAPDYRRLARRIALALATTVVLRVVCAGLDIRLAVRCVGSCETRLRFRANSSQL